MEVGGRLAFFRDKTGNKTQLNQLETQLNSRQERRKHLGMLVDEGFIKKMSFLPEKLARVETTTFTTRSVFNSTNPFPSSYLEISQAGWVRDLQSRSPAKRNQVEPTIPTSVCSTDWLLASHIGTFRGIFSMFSPLYFPFL